MKPRFVFNLSALLLLAFSLPLAGQQFLPKTIQFKGAPEYSDAELMSAAGLKKGTLLNYAEMSSHSKKLMDSGIFETLSFKFDGVDLVYNLSLKSADEIFPLRIENLPLVSGEELDAKLRAHLPLFHGKVPSQGTLLDDVRHELEEMLAAQGLQTTLTTAPYAAPGQHKASAISFSIAKPEVRVGAIHLEGVSPDLQSNVQSFANHLTKTVFDTENTSGNIERAFASFYADKGYAGAKVHATRSSPLTISESAIDIPFDVVIREGHLYKTGSIQLPPDALFTQDELNKAIASSSAAKGFALQDIWSLIAKRYKSKGYLECVVTPHPLLNEATNVADYTVTIDPGPLYHLAYVKFENVSDELRNSLMRHWQMLPGDPFDEQYVESFIVKTMKDDPALRNTLSGVKADYEVMADPQTHEVNCVIRLAKQPMGQ